jgi:uncharacterized protein YcbK (DUF882 family)
MHESRILRLSAVCALSAALAIPSAVGSEIKYPDFPAPRVDTQDALRSTTSSSTLMLLATAPSRGAQPVASTPALRSVLELSAPPPPQLVAFAHALYSAIGEPELPAFLRPTLPVHVYNGNTHEYATFHIDITGHYPDEEKRSIKHLFRCRRTGRRHNMHPRVLRVLADLASRYPGHTIEIVSGYRAPPYGVPKSKHFHGRAIDLRVQGVKTTEVRDYLWRNYDHVGIGHYRGQNFIHVDYRPGYKKIGWTSRRRNAPYRYHPKWTRN